MGSGRVRPKSTRSQAANRVDSVSDAASITFDGTRQRRSMTKRTSCGKISSARISGTAGGLDFACDRTAGVLAVTGALTPPKKSGMVS